MVDIPPWEECGKCLDNKKCYAVEAAVDTATGEAEFNTVFVQFVILSGLSDYGLLEKRKDV